MCIRDRDASVLAPYLQGGPEVVQFVAYYSQTPNGGLPYDMSTTYSTYFAHNMVPGGIPEPVYVTMYGALEAPKPPARQLFKPVPWRHGRFLGSFMYTSKQNLHHIQGLGDVWFAGNNTTLDSEEGALVSAMVIADMMFPDWKYPFYGIEPRSIEATIMYELMKHKVMFPGAPSGLWGHFRHWQQRRLQAYAESGAM